jgi:hypothetical protein
MLVTEVVSGWLSRAAGAGGWLEAVSEAISLDSQPLTTYPPP